VGIVACGQGGEEVSEERERELIGAVLDAVRRETKGLHDQMNYLLEAWKQYIADDQAKARSVLGRLDNLIQPPSVRDLLLAAGWLPPREGRRVYEGQLYVGVGDEIWIGEHPLDAEWDLSRPVRIIIDPLPEKEAEG
jgi:hypothetical protein